MVKNTIFPEHPVYEQFTYTFTDFIFVDLCLKTRNDHYRLFCPSVRPSDIAVLSMSACNFFNASPANTISTNKLIFTSRPIKDIKLEIELNQSSLFMGFQGIYSSFYTSFCLQLTHYLRVYKLFRRALLQFTSDMIKPDFSLMNPKLKIISSKFSTINKFKIWPYMHPPPVLYVFLSCSRVYQHILSHRRTDGQNILQTSLRV